MKGFIAILSASILIALGGSAGAWDIGDIHCDYLEVINGYQCSDYNEWYAPTGEVTQDMLDYYVGYLGYTYPAPNPDPETFYVSGGPTESYS